jgi:hypothetical protein
LLTDINHFPTVRVPILDTARKQAILLQQLILIVISSLSTSGPLIISHEGLQVITADTSYSNNTKWVGIEVEKRSMAPTLRSVAASLDGGNGTRGHAVTEVVFSFLPSAPLHLAETNFHGVLSNGEEYDFTLPAPRFMNAADAAVSLVGHEITDGWWARCILKDGLLLLTKAEGFDCINRVCDVAWARKKLSEKKHMSK